MADRHDDLADGDGRRLRWLEHNQARQRVIIDAAVRVLERAEPGQDVQVQQIADEAGLARTVIYRHFHDRTDLDLAVQRRVCADLGAHLLPQLSYDDRPVEVIRRIIHALVSWAGAHPTLFWFAELELPGPGSNPLSQAIEQIAGRIEALMNAVVDHEGVELTADDRAALDPWVFALIGSVWAGVRRWTVRPDLVPGTDHFVDVLAQTVWVQVEGMATARGIPVPDVPLGQLVRVLGQSEA